MNDDNKPNTPAATPPVPDGTERDLDRMLDLLAPPAPSETLRARLMRDFAPGDGVAPRRGGEVSGRTRAGFGAVAVAAALVLAVALGIVAPPRDTPARIAATAPIGAAVSDIDPSDDLFAAYEDLLEDESDDTDIGSAFAEDAPDSAGFMVATLALGLRANGPAPDGAEPFEGMPLD